MSRRPTKSIQTGQGADARVAGHFGGHYSACAPSSPNSVPSITAPSGTSQVPRTVAAGRQDAESAKIETLKERLIPPAASCRSFRRPALGEFSVADYIHILNRKFVDQVLVTMQTGTVKTFNSERGFGFITRDAGGT